MSAIPPDIHRKLRQVLIDCGPFDDDRQLRAVFADGRLSPWRFSLPQADSVVERVDLVIAFLHNKQRGDTHENALVLFLQVLSERIDPGDACHARIADLAQQLRLAIGAEIRSSPTTPESNPQRESMVTIAADEKLLRRARAVGLVSVPKVADGSMKQVTTGTGWLITPQLALTCWHVVQARTLWESPPSEDDLQRQIENLLLRFGHTLPAQGVEHGLARLEHFHAQLDYALLRLTDRDDFPLTRRGYLALDTDLPLTMQSQLLILQHPQGQIQQRAAGFYVKPSSQRSRILYTAPTAGGASGAPVLNVTNWQVVALHTGENRDENLREGLLLKSILADLSQHRPDLYQEIMTCQNDKE